jgi:hypothetical protein
MPAHQTLVFEPVQQFLPHDSGVAKQFLFGLHPGLFQHVAAQGPAGQGQDQEQPGQQLQVSAGLAEGACGSGIHGDQARGGRTCKIRRLPSLRS